MSTTIREYEDPDREYLIKLFIYLQNFEYQFEKDILARAEDVSKGLFERLISDTRSMNGKIFIAVVDGKIAGFISGHLEENPDDIELTEKKYFYISNIAVLPQYQKRGIGKTLIDNIVAYAKSLNVKTIQINVLAKNTIAYKAYINKGFRDYEKVLIKEVN